MQFLSRSDRTFMDVRDGGANLPRQPAAMADGHQDWPHNGRYHVPHQMDCQAHGAHDRPQLQAQARRCPGAQEPDAATRCGLGCAPPMGGRFLSDKGRPRLFFAPALLSARAARSPCLAAANVGSRGATSEKCQGDNAVTGEKGTFLTGSPPPAQVATTSKQASTRM